ncbi:MAG TPA: NAD(P)/FAD-dependent oxidoreductase [Thermoanaerobaculia bacterium]|nr:NAD(P)/FAD-dependent oxidoreductase [Thermoanaerobaculia bacterium]
MLDAVIVGSGPNGLSAAITLAQEDLEVLVIEAAAEVGGGTRSAALTLDGYLHDVCSAVHPMGALSPFFGTLPLAEHGLHWTASRVSAAHPLDGGRAALLMHSMTETGRTLGPDADAWRRLIAPFVEVGPELFADLLAPLHLPRHPLAMARFGWYGIRSAVRLARGALAGEEARALLAGCAAHSVLPLTRLVTGAVGLVFATSAHLVDWPCARGGSRTIGLALASYLESLGGRIETGSPVEAWSALPPARAYLFDLSPRQLVAIAGERLPARYRRRLHRYRYGPGVFKVDWALDGPIPWQAPGCAEASTVHVGGTLEEVAAAEAAVWRGEHPERPFVLVAQQSRLDPGRAPAGKHTGYAYCHVPSGSDLDMTAAIESQLERFAPGFRDLVLARFTRSARGFEEYNPSYPGGAITGGAQDVTQLFTRPVARLDPYATPNPSIYLCSQATPPGGGVHGMCGHYAARSALARRFGIASARIGSIG